MNCKIEELWISFFKLFFKIRYPYVQYVEIPSDVMSHAIHMSATLATTEADKREWIRVLYMEFYVPKPSLDTTITSILIAGQNAILQQFIK